jgi:pimeloyl-ACP methyl ester carboxylesterase
VARVSVPSGVELAVDDGGRGPAVLCLHGLAGFKELWSELLPLLRDAGFRAIAYDQPAAFADALLGFLDGARPCE